MRIQDHKLAWRWTDPAYGVLPNEALAKLEPATSGDAKALLKRSYIFLGKDGLSSSLQPAVFDIEEISSKAGAGWLKQQQPYLDELVWLSWDAEAALRTTWDIFVTYWPEFCYPASDDLVVFPESEAWVLLYHHEQQFQFGRRGAK